MVRAPVAREALSSTVAFVGASALAGRLFVSIGLEGSPIQHSALRGVSAVELRDTPSSSSMQDHPARDGPGRSSLVLGALGACTAVAAVKRAGQVKSRRRAFNPAVQEGVTEPLGFFDPLGFSTTITELGGDLAYVREAELMHGRQAMLAVVGWTFPAVFGPIFAPAGSDISLDPLVAQYQLSPAVLGQLFVSMAIAEGLRAQKVFDPNVPVGEHGFGVEFAIKQKWIDTPEKLATMKLKEIKHCRLAMIAITGMFFQQALTGHVYPLT